MSYTFWVIFAVFLLKDTDPVMSFIRSLRTTCTSTSIFKGDHYRKCFATFIDNDIESLGIACDNLRKGNLVAFPTETVYGLGANALCDASIRKIFEAKKRPLSDPVIVHVASKDAIHDLFDFQSNAEAGNQCKKIIATLTEEFWPGPLTIIHKASGIVPSVVTANTGFVGVRCPRHPIANQLLTQSSLYIAAPSANRFGHVSPTSAEHVYDDLKNEDLLIIRDDVGRSGGCQVGIESTVCKVEQDGNSVSILRCGMITSKHIDSALKRAEVHCNVIIDNERNIVKDTSTDDTTPETINKASSDSVGLIDGVLGTNSTDVGVENGNGVVGAVAPGQMLKHYAPDVPTFIINKVTSSSECEHALPFAVSSAYVIDFGGSLRHLENDCNMYVDLSASGNAVEACAKLFETLRLAESISKRNLSEGGPPEVQCVLLADLRDVSVSSEVVRALWERLHRAASGQFIKLPTKLPAQP